MLPGDYGILGTFGGPVALWIYDVASTIYDLFCPARKAKS